MIERNLGERAARDREREISLLAVANILLRSRRLVVVLTVTGMLAGLAVALLSVTTQWPSVSLALAEKLIRGVGTFNVERRRSQAAAERQFVDAQAAESERALRDAENALQSFLQRNREYGGSPQLPFERDRLQ